LDVRAIYDVSEVFYSWFDNTLCLGGSDLEAYVLTNTEANALWSVAEATLKIEGVKMAHAVTGQFDVVALVTFPKIEDLGKVIEKIQHLEGARETQTLIAIPPPVRE
jgi:DNA-binding Lrp family transcriptional regulator